jgi:hypothetical protein
VLGYGRQGDVQVQSILIKILLAVVVSLIEALIVRLLRAALGRIRIPVPVP